MARAGETPVAPVSRQDGGSPYGRDKRGRDGYEFFALGLDITIRVW